MTKTKICSQNMQSKNTTTCCHSRRKQPCLLNCTSFSFMTGQVSLPCGILLRTQLLYSRMFSCLGRSCSFAVKNTIYTFSGLLPPWRNFARWKLHFVSRSCVLLLVTILHGTRLVGVSQSLRRGGHHVGHWPTFWLRNILLWNYRECWQCWTEQWRPKH